MKIVKQNVRIIWSTDKAEQIIETAGRTCYKSEQKMDKFSSADFVKMLIRKGHEAMLEHASATFHITTDRGVSHEIVRHRLASYAQESTRYCNYGNKRFENECTFIEPPNLTDEQYKIWKMACVFSERQYFALLNEGCTPQIARSVLPTCLKTEIVMTANFREWRHFIKLRSSKAAHPQIRVIAEKIHNILLIYAVNVFSDLIIEE